MFASWLEQARATYESAQGFSLPEHVRSRLLEGLPISDLEMAAYAPKERVSLFISSTFDDTKFEQDVLLGASPFLKSFCRELGLDFGIVSMRWGVNGRSMDSHLTSELCFQQLAACLKESAGPAFLTLQSMRYGYRPFPNTIRQLEFDAITSAVASDPDAFYLQEPYWRVDYAAVPPVVQLQPISKLPGCEAFLLSDADKGSGDC